MKELIVVSHCILNTCAKVCYLGEKKSSWEDENRQNFLNICLEENIQLLQLPCPEFEMYGSRRWGHCMEQFDNVFFRKRCEELLQPIVLQLQEYMNNEETNVLGIVGLDGSPSCGITKTFSANWRGELSSSPNLLEFIKQGSYAERTGVFMDVFSTLLKNRGISIPMVPLCETTFLKLRGMDNENQA